MPIFIAALLGGLASAVGSLVGRVLIALSIGYVTFTGVSSGLAALQAQVVSDVSSLPGVVLTCAYLLKVDVLVSIAFSAFAARLLLSGLTAGGAITKRVIKP